MTASDAGTTTDGEWLARVAAEPLDVVDQHNRVIFVAARGEVHRLGLRHRAVHVLIEDAAGRLYLQQRALHKDCEPGRWDTSAAGHLDRGEEYFPAARRELAEELALDDVELELVGELPAAEETGQEFVQVFRGRTALEPRPLAAEIMAGGWWTPQAIAIWMAASPEDFTTTFRIIFARYCQAPEQERS
jgi:16S rRNA (adenine1518-N6/adenine1519-N6)-dimethyltransferase